MVTLRRWLPVYAVCWSLGLVSLLVSPRCSQAAVSAPLLAVVGVVGSGGSAIWSPCKRPPDYSTVHADGLSGVVQPDNHVIWGELTYPAEGSPITYTP